LATQNENIKMHGVNNFKIINMSLCSKWIYCDFVKITLIAVTCNQSKILEMSNTTEIWLKEMRMNLNWSDKCKLITGTQMTVTKEHAKIGSITSKCKN
jgi:hypothetical protein